MKNQTHVITSSLLNLVSIFSLKIISNLDFSFKKLELYTNQRKKLVEINPNKAVG